MKININKENIKKYIENHPLQSCGAFALALIMITASGDKIVKYVTRENAAGYNIVTEEDRKDKKVDLILEEFKQEVESTKKPDNKYIYNIKEEQLKNSLGEVKDFTLSSTFLPLKNSEKKNEGTFSLEITLDNYSTSDEQYEQLNDTLYKLFKNFHFYELTVNGLDLSKLENKTLKQMQINTLTLMNCKNDFDYKYFNTKEIETLWIYGREGYQEQKEHYDLREYSYTKKLIIAGDASFKNLDKMVGLQSFTLFNYQNMSLKKYEEVVSSLNEIYRLTLTPFSSIWLHNAPSQEIILPPTDFIGIETLPHAKMCDIIVNTEQLVINNMCGDEYNTKIIVSGYIGSTLTVENARISDLNINEVDKYGEDITYSFSDSHLDLYLEDINKKMKNVHFNHTNLTYDEDGELIKTDEGIKVFVEDYKIKVKD